MKNLIILLSVALLASCANPSAKNHIKNIESQIVVTDSGEDFGSFYHYFVSDSIFQAERVVFPFDVVRSRILDTGVEMDSVIHFSNKTGWDYLRISDHQDPNGATQELTFNIDSTEVNLKTPDESATVNTSFIRENGKWYLNSYNASAGGYGW